MLVIEGQQNCFHHRVFTKSITKLTSQRLPIVSYGDQELPKVVHTNYVGNPGLYNEHSLVGSFKYR